MDKRKVNNAQNADIGKRIRRLCQQKEMSFQVLARQADISQAVLYNILSGKANPRLSTLQLICEELGITLEQLFSTGQNREEVTDAEMKTMIGGLNGNERRMLMMYLELLCQR